VALLDAEDALQQGKPALGLERARFVLQRSALSPSVLGLYAAALEATGHCAELVTLAANASALFDSSCRVGGTPWASSSAALHTCKAGWARAWPPAKDPSELRAQVQE
jgi:hypothetical protein